jgi:hypothetical protein
MSAVSAFPSTQGSDWRTLYRAAILEPDPAMISIRIAEAKKEIVQRARELFQEDRNDIEEAQALDSAMCTLHVFRSTLRRNGEGSAAKESQAA